MSLLLVFIFYIEGLNMILVLWSLNRVMVPNIIDPQQLLIVTYILPCHTACHRNNFKNLFLPNYQKVFGQSLSDIWHNHWFLLLLLIATLLATLVELYSIIIEFKTYWITISSRCKLSRYRRTLILTPLSNVNYRFLCVLYVFRKGVEIASSVVSSYRHVSLQHSGPPFDDQK